MKNNIYFYINDNKVKDTKNKKNIIDYLDSMKIEIPYFCYHNKLTIAGNCRMCIIELKNSSKPLISCSMNIVNEMEIYTNSPLVKKARENILEFLLFNHPLDCPVCDQGGECDLQDQSMLFGTSKKRFFKYKISVTNKNLGPIVKTIMTRCIHCTRCIRFANEIAGIENLGTFGRGSNMEIGTYLNKIFYSELSGNIIDICPVGALTSKPYSFIERKWELNNYKTFDFSDGLTSDLVLSVKNENVITKIVSGFNKNIKLNNWISDKTRFSFEGMFSPERNFSVNLFSKNKYKKFQTWLTIFKEINFLIYFQDHLNKYFYNSNKLFILINTKNVSLEIITILILLEKKHDFIELRKIDTLKLITDFKNNFILNTANKINNLNFSNFCILFNVNTRYEGCNLNLKLRKRYLKGNFRMFSINSFIDLTYPLKTIGSNIKILKKMVEGNHFLCQEIKYSKNPLIICSSQLLQRNDSFIVNKMLNSFNNNIKLINKKWNGLNVLNTNLNESGSYIIKNFRSFTEVDYINSLGIFFIEISNNLKNILPKIIEIKLLNYINIEKPRKLFLIDQSSLFPISNVQNFNSNLNLNVVIQLPSKNFLEDSGIYINTEGFYKKTMKIILSKLQTKNNWEILRQLLLKLEHVTFLFSNKKNKVINFFFNNKNIFFQYIKFHFFPLINFNFFFNSFESIKKQYSIILNIKFQEIIQKIYKTKIIIWIEDFFLGGNDSYSIFSKVLIKCSKYFRVNLTNFNYAY